MTSRLSTSRIEPGWEAVTEARSPGSIPDAVGLDRPSPCDPSPPATSPAPYPPQLQGWWTVSVLTGLCAVSLMDRNAFTLLVDPISKSLGINDFQIAILSGLAFAIFYATFGVGFGWAVDRYSRRSLIFSGVTVWSAATMACGLARNFTQLAFARFGVGAGEAALNPAAYSLIADSIPRARLTTAIAVFGSGVMIGGLIANVGAALLITALPPEGLHIQGLGQLEPWRLVFLVLGLPGFLLGFLVLTFREPLRRQRMGVAPSAGLGTTLAFMRQRWRFYGPFFAGAGFIAACNYATAAWYPAFFMRTYGLSVAETGFLLGPLLVIPQIIGMLGAGGIADRQFARGQTDIHLRLLIIMAAGKAGLVAVAMGGDVPLWVAATLVGLASLFVGIVGIGPAMVQFVTPNEFRGQVSAIYLFAYTFVGQCVGPTVAGALTTFVFNDPNKIGLAVAAMFIVFTPPACLCLWAALRSAREIAAEAESWTG